MHHCGTGQHVREAKGGGEGKHSNCTAGPALLFVHYANGERREDNGGEVEVKMSKNGLNCGFEMVQAKVGHAALNILTKFVDDLSHLFCILENFVA